MGGCCGGAPDLSEIPPGRIVGSVTGGELAEEWYGCAFCGAIMLGEWLADHKCLLPAAARAPQGAAYPFLYDDPIDGV